MPRSQVFCEILQTILVYIMLKQWIVFFVHFDNGYSKSGYPVLFRSLIHLHLLFSEWAMPNSHKLRAMVSWFVAVTNKEISQIISNKLFPKYTKVGLEVLTGKTFSVWLEFVNETGEKVFCLQIQIKSCVNPFAPEPPVTARVDPGPFYSLWHHQFLTVKDNFLR